MRLCVRSLIPCLFPFLVLNGLLIHLGFPEIVGRGIGKKVGKRLGVQPHCVSAVVIGLLCGFPSGAAAAYVIRKKGLCCDDDFQRTVLLSSIPAPAFSIVTVGMGLFGDPKVGGILWLISLGASLVMGAFEGNRSRSTVSPAVEAVLAPRPFMLSLSDSLKEGANAMLSICGAVIFFSVLSGFLHLLPIPFFLQCILTSALELSSGVAICASSLSRPLAFVTIAWAMSWSGLSVHAQIAAVTDGALHVRRFWIRKLSVSLLAAVFASLFVLVFGF
jgi:hypothetical protein